MTSPPFPPFEGLAEAKTCPHCNGEGWVASQVCTAARPSGSIYGSSMSSENVAIIGGRGIRCSYCMNGFLFRIIPASVITEYLLSLVHYLVMNDETFKMKLATAVHQGIENKLEQEKI